MIKNVIFDFGNVLLPIDEEKKWEAFKKLGSSEELKDGKELFRDYERGKLSTTSFIQKIRPFFFRKKIFSGDLKDAWNAIVYAPIPEENISLLKKLSKDYKLFLMSNTNELNMQKIRENTGPFLFNQFRKQFVNIYLSYEKGLCKPDEAFFKMILEENDLSPEETLFVDDIKKSIQIAEKTGIHTWHFKPGEDSIADIEKKLSKALSPA